MSNDIYERIRARRLAAEGRTEEDLAPQAAPQPPAGTPTRYQAPDRFPQWQPGRTEEPQPGHISTGLRSGLQSAAGTIAGTVGYLGEVAGSERLADWGYDRYQAAMEGVDERSRPQYHTSNITSLRDMADFARYWAAYGVAQLGITAATGGLGSLAARGLARRGIERGVQEAMKRQSAQQLVQSELARMGPQAAGSQLARREAEQRVQDLVRNQILQQAGGRGFLAGAAPTTFGQTIGETYGEAREYAEEQGTDLDLGRIAAGGIAAGAVEYVGDIATLGLARVGPGSRVVDALTGTGGSLPSRVAGRGFVGFQTQGLTELVQEPIITTGASKPLDTLTGHDLLTAYLGGGMGGGVVGGVSGIPARSEEDAAVAAAEPEERLAMQAQRMPPLQDPEQIAAQQAQQQQQAELQQQQEMQRRALIDRYQPQFTSQQEFIKARAQQQTEQMLDETTPLGEAFRNWRIENEIYDRTPRTQKQFLRDYAPDDAEQARAEYEAALEQFAQRRQAIESRSPEEQARIQGFTEALLEDLAEAQEANNIDAVARIEQHALTELDPTEWSEAKQAFVAQQAEAQQVQQEAQRQAEAAERRAARPPTKREQARTYAEEQLGENWEADNPDLSQMVETNAVFGANPRFNRAVDRAVAERQREERAAQEETMDVPAAVEEAATQIEAVADDLSPNQRRVFDTLLNAFRNNEGDRYVRPDGTFNFQDLAKDSGVRSRQAAENAVRQIRPKIAEAFGVTEDEVGTALQQTRTRVAPESFVEQEVGETVFDARELVDSDLATLGTIATVGGSQTDVGLATSEELAAAEARPDPVAEQRAQEAQERAEQIREQNIEEALNSPIASEARRMWNQWKSEGAPNAEQLPRGVMADWIMDYTEWAVGTVDDAYIDNAQRDAERAVDTLGGPTIEALEATTPETTPETTPAPVETAPAPTEPVTLTRVAKADDYALTGNYNVQLSDGRTIPVYYDRGSGPVTAGWYYVTPEGVTLPTELGPAGGMEVSLNDNETGKGFRGAAAAVTRAANEGTLPEVLTTQEITEVTTDETAPEQVVADESDAVSEAVTTAPRRVREAEPTEAERAAVPEQLPADESSENSVAVNEALQPDNINDERKVGTAWDVHPSTVNVPFEALNDSQKKQFRGILKSLQNERITVDQADTQIAQLAANVRNNRARYSVRDNPDGSTTDRIDAIKNASLNLRRRNFEGLIERLTGRSRNWRVQIFNTQAEAAAARERGEIQTELHQGIMGWVEQAPFTSEEAARFGRITSEESRIRYLENRPLVAHLIMENVPAGRELGVFLHEVGAHLGIDRILPAKQINDLAAQIKKWSDSPDNNVANIVARRTAARVENAKKFVDMTDSEMQSEWIAYFIEESVRAGVNPSSVRPTNSFNSFLRRIWNAFKRALDRLDVNVEGITPQEIVDLAYGAARHALVSSNALAAVETIETFPAIDSSERPLLSKRPYTVDQDIIRVGRRKSDAYRPGNIRFSIADPSDAAQKTAANEYNRTVSENVKKNLGDTARQFWDDAAYLLKNAADSTKFLHQFIREVSGKMPSAGKWYRAVLESEKTRNDLRQKVESIAIRAKNMPADRLALVNDFIGRSTFEQKWGYDPQIPNKTVTPDPVMEQQFNNLNSQEQQLVKDIFAHGEEMAERKRTIAKTMGLGTDFFSTAKLEGPYAPLKRFGNFAAELKSQELLDAEAEYESTRSKKVQKEIERLKSSEEHYVISFFDTMGAARRFTRANQDRYAYTNASPRTEQMESGRVSDFQSFQKVLGALRADENSGMDKNARNAFERMVKDLYFHSLDEANARLSGIRRKNRAGYEKNMIRSFLAHSRSEAGLLASMEHGSQINAAYISAQKEAAKNREELQPVFNMIAKHYKDMLSHKHTPIQDRVAAINTVYMLTSSVGYHLQNATQPTMVTLPKLAGDFNNYTGAWNALFSGYKIAWNVARGRVRSMQTDIDPARAPFKYRKLLDEMQLLQLLDVGMEADLSEFNRSDTGYEALNRLTDTAGKWTHRLYQVARWVEGMNRVSAAVAAYDMALANPEVTKRMKVTPEQYAINIVQDTQGNFSRVDAPLLLKTLPKVTVQYRKFQVMMAWMYANAFKQAFRGEDAYTRAAGARTASYALAHAGIFAGTTGVPILTSTAAWFLAFTNDGDEPQDLERWIRENVRDQRLADLLARGVFGMIGIDMSAKLTQANIFSPLPYSNFEMSPQGVSNYVFDAVAGPAGSTGKNFIRAHEYAKQGDIYKAIEFSVPKGIRTAMESYRLGTEGFTTRNGELIADPTEFGIIGLLSNTLGVPGTDIARIKWRRSQQFELERYFRDESSKLRQQYIRAQRSGNQRKMAELRDQWVELQRAKDRVRPFFSGQPDVLRRQPLSYLTQSERQMRQREERMRRQLGTD